MAEKIIRNEQWLIRTLMNKITTGDITKPKYQRKKKWDVLRRNKQNDTCPNEQDYINFLFKTHNSVHAITFGENRSNLLENIDGNNRINAICHFMKTPFELFSDYLKELFDIIESLKVPTDIEVEVKEYFKSMSYTDIMDMKIYKFCLTPTFISYFKCKQTEIFDCIEQIQTSLKLNSTDRFDTHVKINVNLFQGYTTEELAQVFEDINKYNTKLTEIELMACRLYDVNKFEIKNPVITTQIQEAIITFYKNKSDDEVLSCYQFNKSEAINAYDFIVGFQAHCHIQYPMIEETDTSGMSLFFKIYKTLYKKKGILEDSFTTTNVNEFITLMIECGNILNKIKEECFTENINESLFNKTCNKKFTTLKKNNMYLIIISIIGYLKQKVSEKTIQNSIQLSLFYHFFTQDIQDKDKRKEMQVNDTILFEGGGSQIEKLAEDICESPSMISDKITTEKMTNLITTLYTEGNRPALHKPSARRDRRSRKFFEKTLIFYYYKEKIPTNLLKNDFQIEHICPFSSSWINEIDIDRLGNIIPILASMNSSRSNKHISEYSKEPFTAHIKDMIPTLERYDIIISHLGKPNVLSNDVYNDFCQMNEQRYLQNFVSCMFKV